MEMMAVIGWKTKGLPTGCLLDRRSFGKQKPVLCYGDLVKLRIVSFDHVLWSGE